MNLFELFATLKMDTSQFDTGVDKAIADSGKIEEAIKAISAESIEEEISSIQKDIDDLDEVIAELDAEIDSLSGDIDGLSGKGELVKGVIDGVVDAGVELAEKAIEAMFEFANESLDIAAESGTTVGNNLKRAREEFALTSDVLQYKLGQALAPVATAVIEFSESLLGITNEEKLTAMFEQLESYKLDNLYSVQTTLEGIFGTFQKYEPDEEVQSLWDMTEALDSQIAYWEEYNRVVNVLRERGFSDSLLAEYADGQTDSLATLQAFADASDEELKAISERFSTLETARNDAAASISAAQLEVDTSVDQMNDSIMRLGVDIAAEAGASNVYTAAQNIIEALSANYSGIASQVDAINAKLSQLGQASMNAAILSGEYVGPMTPHATGLDYVPYNEYPALLHEGEAVLTKSEANAWRRGEVNGVVPDFTGLAEAIAEVISDRPVAINIDGKAFATIMAREMSRSIGNRNIQTLMGMGG